MLPGGAGPVSVTNIHPQYQNCGPKNETYYGGTNTAQIETNFNGRTIPLTAKATVIPGKPTILKLCWRIIRIPTLIQQYFLKQDHLISGENHGSGWRAAS